MPSPLPLDVFSLVTLPFQENTLFVSLPQSPECVVIDPGFGAPRIVECLKERRQVPVAILLTHGHVDHIAGVEGLRQTWPELPILIGAGDAPMLTDPQLNLSGLFGFPLVAPPATETLHDLQQLTIAGIPLEVREIPGHSPGHVVYIYSHATQPLVFGGDVLFQGSIGRTDFPGGSQDLLVAGIRQKLFDLPDATIVFPGHGPTTTIGDERLGNPYCSNE
ncbi:MAG: MBL fold metallo-hydrolase [Planctomycetaceae bacterium]|jgi:hydroxyacylglutathione hydrolase